ncbi:DUF3347 domain-containing protein [Flavobacterium lacustre]|uniref:DUF3347 domain-containing protein n=1 Tax=Flavobacterium lacustre TaxID=3016339 RepID=UPI0022B6680C|nr:DUF3347 domain-containing protein [Flavobacterium lacustre]
MKNIFLSAIAMAFVLVSCNKKNKEEATTNTSMMEHDSSMVMSDGSMMDKNSEKATSAMSSNTSIDVIVANYLKLKNALANDNSKEAANSGNDLLASIGKVDMNSISKEQMKTYMDIADDLKENAEHIGENAGKLDHQREHFVLVSKDINDLIATFGTNQKLYQDFCPMADEGKGAIWISETKEIKNPYLGAKMPTCGTIKKEF